MKHKLLMVLQFTIAFVLIGGMLTSRSAGAEFQMNYHLSGKFVYADFIDDQNDQLISGLVQVSDVMEKFIHDPPERPGPMGFLTIRIDEESVDDVDSYQSGTAIIELTNFNISNDLSSAHVEGYGTLIWDQLSPSDSLPESEEITIDITWTSEHQILWGHNNLRSSYDNIRTVMHLVGTFRYATASGLIKGETFEIEVKPPPPPEPYPSPVPIPDSSATIGRTHYGFLSINKKR